MTVSEPSAAATPESVPDISAALACELAENEIVSIDSPSGSITLLMASTLTKTRFTLWIPTLLSGKPAK